MNEPQSIAAERIALSIMAGEDRCGNPLVRPADLLHLSLASGTLWPIAPTSSLFSYQVPASYCMIWTYISVYTTLADESSPAVNYGFNYDALAFLGIQAESGNFLPFSQSFLTQTVFNCPLLLVFDPKTTPRIFLSSNASTQPVGNLRVEARANAYLLSAGLISAFKPFETRFN